MLSKFRPLVRRLVDEPHNLYRIYELVALLMLAMLLILGIFVWLR